MDNFIKKLPVLSKQIDQPAQAAPGEKAEESILEHLEEGVVTMNRDLSIVKINPTAEKITGVLNENAAGKDFFTIFYLYDYDKNLIDKNKFPHKDFTRSFIGFAEENVYIQNAGKSLVPIDFKFSAIKGPEGEIGSFLFVFNEKYREKGTDKPNRVMLESLDRFETLLIQNLDSSPRRMIHFYQNLELLYKLSVGEIPGLLSDMDVGESVKKVFERKVGLSYEYKVELFNSVPASPLPIKTNRFVFEKALEKILELGIFIASRSDNRYVLVSTGLTNENIFIFIRSTVYDNFPWESAAELIKPFFGSLSHEEKLLQASGLEGYLAESLLKAKGFEGGITGEKYDDGVNNPQLILTVILPYTTETNQQKP
jgi:hypothetical protein